MMKRGGFLLLMLSVSILTLTASVLAQSGRSIEAPVTTPTQEKQTQGPTNTANLEKVKLILSDGWKNFVKDLNANGKSGYRLEKSVSYGGQGANQSYAAVLRLDAGNTYEYDWISSPNRKLLDLRLNAQAKKGFHFASTFALTFCDDEPDFDASETERELARFQFLKGNAFLLERKNGSTAQSKEYKVFHGTIGPRKDAKKNIQAALDAAPPGFHPVKILISKEGFLDFGVSVLLEKNLPDDQTPKIDYRFIKEATGFDKEVNKLAAQGFRFVAGARIGLVKFALMAKQANDATAYSFVDDEEHAKKFDKEIAQGKRYHGLMEGDLRCDASEVVNQKLVFALASGGAKHEYKIFNVFNRKTRNHSADSLVEFQRLMAENYQVKDLFYSDGLNVVLEK